MTAKIIPFPKQTIEHEEMYSDGVLVVTGESLTFEWSEPQDPNTWFPAKPKSYFEMPDGTIVLNWLDKPHE